MSIHFRTIQHAILITVSKQGVGCIGKFTQVSKPVPIRIRGGIIDKYIYLSFVIRNYIKNTFIIINPATCLFYNITNTSMVLSWYHGHDGAAGAGGHAGPTDNDTGFIKLV